MTYESESENVPRRQGKCTFKYIWRTWLINIGLICVIVFYTFVGAVAFNAIEGGHETQSKIIFKDLKEDIIEELLTYPQNNSEIWAMIARYRLTQFEQEIWKMKNEGIANYTEETVWTLTSALFYSWTLITTIGYGNIAPVTKAGRAVTIAYSAIGIPLLLVVLANIGKIFTRMVKSVWKFVRRYYYTGSFKKKSKSGSSDLQAEDNEYKIDDDFNLPITVAVIIWIIYLLIGSVLFCQWESWSYFEAFYFCFISLSTIGLGDIIPDNPVYMLLASFYVALGLAITSMVINVIQEFLEESYKMAAASIVGPGGIEDYAAGEGKVEVISKIDIVSPSMHIDEEVPIVVKSETLYFTDIPDIPAVFTKVFDESKILQQYHQPEEASEIIVLQAPKENEEIQEIMVEELNFEEQYISQPDQSLADLESTCLEELEIDITETAVHQMPEIIERAEDSSEKDTGMTQQEIEEIKQENYEIIETTEEIKSEEESQTPK